MGKLYMLCTLTSMQISLCLDLNISQQDECFCSKLRLEEDHAKSNPYKTYFLRFW